MKDIIVLGIESSCDETSVAVVKNGREVLSNIIDTQIKIHEQFGGVVPEIASRNHIEAISRVAQKALEGKKGEEIRVIDISDVSVLADYFIIANGSNTNQVQALCDNVTEVLGRAGVHSRQVEGYETANWILLDFGDVIVHVFDKENRLFYDLERIWRDGKLVESTSL